MKKYFAITMLCAAAGGAMAQTPCPTPENCVTNPSFEAVNPFLAEEPRGWHNLSHPNEAIRRSVGDGLLPTLSPVGTPNALTPHSGDYVIAIKTDGNSEFFGFTTDIRNFFVSGFPFHDPIFDFNGGDVLVTGYYMIPAEEALVGDAFGVKLEVKLGNQPYATLDPWPERPETVISGHTNGVWQHFEVRWTIADIQAEVIANENEGYFTLPPYPNHLKITLGRWAPFNPASSGVIYLDDVYFQQVIPGPACPWGASGCFADFTGDGGIDGDDVIAFFGDWDTSGACADVTGDGGVDGDDVIAFFAAWDSNGTGFPGC